MNFFKRISSLKHSLKNLYQKRKTRLKDALTHIKNYTKTKKLPRKAVAIISLIAFIFGLNIFFWRYRAIRKDLELQSQDIQNTQEWEIKLDEKFFEEEQDEEKHPEPLPQEDKTIPEDEPQEIPLEPEPPQPQEEIQPTSLLSTMAMPSMGNVMKVFAVDNLVYSKTLEQWSIHEGIDIAADLGTPVRAAIDGKVEKVIKNDPKLGIVVIIDHGANLKTLYANLSSDKLVKKGQAVKKGQVIGAIGNTAPYEIEDPPHLHFEVLLDGQNIDPQQYLPKLN